jgi:hypothetical protein
MKTSIKTRLAWIAGTPAMELRHQILNVITFLAVCAGIFFLIVDNLFGFQPEHLGFVLSVIVVFSVLYWMVRFRGMVTVATHFITLAGFALCAANYFFNDGYHGATPMIGVVVTVFLAAVHRPKTSLLYAPLAVAVAVGCVVVEAWHPEWVEHYPSEQSKLVDLLCTFLFCAGMGFFMMRMAMLLFHQAMDRSRQAQIAADRAASMAALGETLAGIGREFSGPVDALGSALAQTSRWWDDEMPRFQKVLAQLTLAQTAAFWQFLNEGLQWRHRPDLDDRTRRTHTDMLAARLEARGLSDAVPAAEQLLAIRMPEWNPLWQPLMLSSEGREAFLFALRLLGLERVMMAGRDAHGQIEHLVERVTPVPTPR